MDIIKVINSNKEKNKPIMYFFTKHSKESSEAKKERLVAKALFDVSNEYSDYKFEEFDFRCSFTEEDMKNFIEETKHKKVKTSLVYNLGVDLSKETTEKLVYADGYDVLFHNFNLTDDLNYVDRDEFYKKHDLQLFSTTVMSSVITLLQEFSRYHRINVVDRDIAIKRYDDLSNEIDKIKD